MATQLLVVNSMEPTTQFNNTSYKQIDPMGSHLSRLSRGSNGHTTSNCQLNGVNYSNTVGEKQPQRRLTMIQRNQITMMQYINFILNF